MKLDISKIKPLGGRVLLKIQHHAVKSPGGLYIPDAEKKRSPLGKVVRCSDDVTGYNVGDLIYFDQYEGFRVDEEHILLKKEHLYAHFQRED